MPAAEWSDKTAIENQQEVLPDKIAYIKRSSSEIRQAEFWSG